MYFFLFSYLPNDVSASSFKGEEFLGEIKKSKTNIKHVKKDLEDVQSPKEEPKRSCRTVRALISFHKVGSHFTMVHFAIRLYFKNEEGTVLCFAESYVLPPTSTYTLISF